MQARSSPTIRLDTRSESQSLADYGRRAGGYGGHGRRDGDHAGRHFGPFPAGRRLYLRAAADGDRRDRSLRSAGFGPLSGNTQVEISGTNLANAVGVLFGTTLVVQPNIFDSIDSATGNWVVFATSPISTATGPVAISVLTAGGFSATSTAPTDQFTYVPGPAVSQLTPQNYGPYEGGNTVTINGSNLGDATLGGVSVYFGLGNPATIVSGYSRSN